MKNVKYINLVQQLSAQGKDFTRDVAQLSISELTEYSELARAYGYRKPLLHSRGYGFYMLLRRVWQKENESK